MARVLIVDDEKSIRVTLRAFLAETGHTVHTAEDGESALRALAEAAFDVVVADYVLPTLSGREWVTRMRASFPSLQIVLITGDPSLEIAMVALQAGAIDLLGKPLTKMAILDAVARAAGIKANLDRVLRLQEENRQQQQELRRLLDERTRERQTRREAANAAAGGPPAPGLVLQAHKLELISALAGGVAHEINNHLTGIMNYAQLVGEDAGPTSPAAGYAKEILAETEQVATVARHLLALVRSEAQERRRIRPCDAVGATLALMKATFRRNQTTLSVDVPETLPALACRSQSLQQVLMDLLAQAQDRLNARYPVYNPAKSVRLYATELARGDRPWVRVTVEDRGGEMPAELRQMLAEPYGATTQTDSEAARRLAIDQQVIHEHGGELTLECDPGQWQRLHVDLPADDGAAGAGPP